MSSLLLQQALMEEIAPIMSRKSSEHSDKVKTTPQLKINELHDLVQSYLYSCDDKKIHRIFPDIQKAKLELESKQRQKFCALQFKPSHQQLVQFHQIKNSLVQAIQKLAKELESCRNKTKQIKMSRKELEDQLSRSSQALKELQQKCSKYEEGKTGMKGGRKSTFPRISGFNYNLHHADPRKSNNHTVATLDSSRISTKTQDEKQNFYNSINFRRIKQIEKLLDEITAECPSHRFQKILIGNGKESIVKKVFRNFTINDYFDNFMLQKHVLKFLIKIEKQ